MSTLPRIQYNSINVDFDRGVNVWNMVRNQSRVENESAAGIVETLSYFERDRVAIQRRVTSADLQAQLEQFWAYARTGQTFSFWRDRDLAAYWDFEGKSYASNDAVAGTFTRATAAYYTDPSTGYVTSVTSGNARFPAGKFGRGLLIERAGTNILVRSEEFDNASWTKTSITVSANTTETRDPSGGTAADKLTLTAATGSLRQDTSTNISTDSATFTVWLRYSLNGTKSGTLYIIRADTGATLTSQAITITSSWQRFSVTHSTTGSIAANWGVQIDLTTNAAVYYAWGADLKVGSGVKYQTGYVQTTSASATRNAEVLTYTASNFFNDEPTTGTISFWFSPNYGSSNIALSKYFFELDDVGNSYLGIELFLNTSGGLLASVFAKDGTNGASATGDIGEFASGEWIHLAMTWDTTTTNGVKIYVNGALNATSSNSAFAVQRIGANLYVGQDHNGNQIDGVLDELEIRKDVLTAAQISRRYTSGLAKGWRRNYYSSMLIDQNDYEPQLLEGGWRFNLPIVMKEVLT